MTPRPPSSVNSVRRWLPTDGEVLRDVDLFASGHYRGKDYTVADLEEIAKNFSELGPQGLKLLDPPAALGHEEVQEFLDRTDLPAAGWVRRVKLVKYHEPATGQTEAVLKGDIVGVPKSIANLIRSGQYRKVSAEIYSDFTDDFGKSHGKALRRVAFLGAEVPQVKRIGDLPMPEPATAFSEARPVHLRPAAAVRRLPGTRNETVVCFSEVVAMSDGTAPTRQDQIEQILAAMPNLGMPTLEGMTDDQLADLAKNLPPVQPPDPIMTDPMMSQGVMPGMGGMPQPGVPAMGETTLTRDEMIAELSAMGQDPAALQGMDDAALTNLYAQMTAGGSGMAPMADGEGLTTEEMIAELVDLGQEADDLAEMTPEEIAALYAEMTAAPAEAPAEEVAAMSERRRSQARANRYATMSERVARANLGRTLAQHHQIKRQEAETFCDRLTQEGRMLPAQRDIFLGFLMSKDHLNRVVKFSDGKQTLTLTAFEVEKRKLARQPVVVRFAERVAAAKKADAAKGGPTREIKAVARWAEQHASALATTGKTPQQYVEKFSEMVKKNPSITAATLIGPGAKDYYPTDDDE